MLAATVGARDCIFLREPDVVCYSLDWKSKSSFGFYEQFPPPMGRGEMFSALLHISAFTFVNLLAYQWQKALSPHLT